MEKACGSIQQRGEDMWNWTTPAITCSPCHPQYLHHPHLSLLWGSCQYSPGQGRIRSHVCRSISAFQKLCRFFFATDVTSPLGKGKLVCNYVIISHPEAQLMHSVTPPQKGEVCWMHDRNINSENFSLQLCFSIFLIALIGRYVKRTEFRSVRVYIWSCGLILMRCTLPHCALFQDLPACMNGVASAQGILLQ